MCGIIGDTNSDKQTIRESLAKFAYRGPDARAFYEDAVICLGHARLSVIDLDRRSTQPFFDAEKETAIVYNGEIYNYKELRTELEREHGVRFRTTSDTEVLVYGYKVWGEKLLPKLRGMFAFAMYDMRARTVFLARDHAGIKPLYYSLTGSALRFASEPKGVVGLLRKGGEEVRVDRDALALYPVFGYIPSPKTLVEGVLKLERGSWLRYALESKAVETGKWTPQTREIRSREELEDAVKRSMLEHCIADVPVGTLFSGGVDSSLIAAVLQEAGMQLETFSIRVADRPADEPYFKEIAKRLGVKAHVADFGLTEFEALYDDVLGKMDEPIADAAIFPSTLVSRIASERVKVVLSGEGGDELFLGYPRAQVLARMRAGRPLRVFDSVFTKTPPFRGKNKLFSSLAEQLSLPAAYYLLQTSPARDLSLSTAWRTAEEMLSREGGCWYDRDWYLENMLLRKTDMATSYASIEGRVPLLGVELWNAAPGFMHENLAQGGGKEVLKSMLAKHIPRELIDRPKAGFGIGIARLFRESRRLSDDLTKAMTVAHEYGLPSADERLIKERYPVYGFGLVVLMHALENLGF